MNLLALFLVISVICNITSALLAVLFHLQSERHRRNFNDLKLWHSCEERGRKYFKRLATCYGQECVEAGALSAEEVSDALEKSLCIDCFKFNTEDL